MAELEKARAGAHAPTGVKHVVSWEEQCLKFNEYCDRVKEEERIAFRAELGLRSFVWRFVPHLVKKMKLEKHRCEAEARVESRDTMCVLLKRRHEMTEACRHDSVGARARDAESYRLDLLLIGQGGDRKHLNILRGGNRTAEMDLMRARFSLHEFDELFFLNKFCELFSSIEDQQREMGRIWERMLYLRCNFALEKPTPGFEGAGGATYVRGRSERRTTRSPSFAQLQPLGEPERRATEGEGDRFLEEVPERCGGQRRTYHLRRGGGADVQGLPAAPERHQDQEGAGKEHRGASGEDEGSAPA
jgi:hypothetical protein